MNLEAKFKTKRTQLYKISDLTLMAEWPDDYPSLAKIKDSIEKEGLLYPILLMKTKLHIWKGFVDKKYNLRSKIVAPIIKGKYHFVVRVGNQRVKIAKELGYSYIDCHLLIRQVEMRYIKKKMKNGSNLEKI